MTAILKKIPISVKLTVAIFTPLLITVITFYFYGLQIANTEQIYPNITIAGTDVSGLTRDEAMLSLGLPAYVERSSNVNVTIIFPDNSKLIVTGSDANLNHNARDIVNEAYSVGRGSGTILDAVSFLRRSNADKIAFDIDFLLDSNVLSSKVTAFVEEYNDRLDASTPAIYNDKIVMTKGAGHVNADINTVYSIVHSALYQSLDNGEPVNVTFSLPESDKVELDIFDVRRKIMSEMVSSEFDPDTNTATECNIGVDFDAIEAARLLRNAQSGKTVELPLIFTHPEYSQEYLDSLLFRDLLGQRTTWAHGTQSRLENINLSSSAINGLVLLPGEEFSFNETVGQRTYETGYRAAPAFARGETIMAIGGGICQTSSTIYAAIRPSELQITERHAHGQPVAYLPAGWDATVAWDVLDFRFVNNTNYPIRIEVELEGRHITAQVYGTIIDDFPRKAGWND